MLKRVFALAAALALGVVMAGCQPAEEGGADGGGGGMEQRDRGDNGMEHRDQGETMASPSPGAGGMMND